jgi:hypothetical protein
MLTPRAEPGPRRDATFKELATLIKEVHPDARRKEVSMSFQTVRVPAWAWLGLLHALGLRRRWGAGVCGRAGRVPPA